jgi:hypothetical protein
MAGKEQKSSEKGPLEAIDSANFARDTSDFMPAKDDPAKCGYLLQDYPSAGPAYNNTKINMTRDSIGSLGNDGTSRNSYPYQPDIVSAEDPNIPTINGKK